MATAGLVAVAGCRKPAGPAGAMMGPPGTPVTVAVADTRNVPVFLDEIGKAVASQSVTIQPQVTGKIKGPLPFKDGADVKVGQPLFEIEEAPFLAVLHQAQGQKARDTAMYNNAKSVVKRDTDAVAGNQGAVSQTQVDADKASMDEAFASMAADDASIESAQINLQYCKITSPIDGKAGVRLVDPGNVVNAAGQGAGTSLLTIQTMDPIYVDFTITEQELTRVRQYMADGTLQVQAKLPEDKVPWMVGTPAVGTDEKPAATQPTAAPGESHPDDAAMPGIPPETANAPGPDGTPTTQPAFRPRIGRLIFLDNSVQDGTGTVKLRAQLPNKDRHFWPGQFVDVRLVLTVHKDAVLVPNIATQVSQQGLFVYKVIPDEKSPTKLAAVLQPVTLGQRQGADVVIESGLSAGDKVVATGQTLLQPGAPVMVVPSGPPPTGGPGGPPKVGPGTLQSPAGEGEPKSAAGGSGAPVAADSTGGAK